MNRKGPFDPRKDAHLLSAYVDGELESDDEARISAHLEENAEARQEVEKLRQLKNITNQMRLKEPPNEVWEVFWDSVYNRAERSVGWVLLAVGAVLLAAWTMVKLATALVSTNDLPMVVKAGVFIVTAGVFTLLVSVVRERIYRRGRTRYKDIKR